MKKVLYVPLDDRPCNYKYPHLLAELSDDIELITPPIEIMGRLKKPAELGELWTWVFENINHSDYAILSLDTLIYGNIVNSRLHHRTKTECDAYFEKIKRLKAINPKIEIHAFNLAARVSNANNSSEDPDYWQNYGTRIWEYSYLTDKVNRGQVTSEEKNELEKVKSEIPEEYLKDFLNRRETDRYVNLQCIELLKNRYIDFLVIPKDDTAEYGYAALDQKAIASKVCKYRLMNRVMVYPGADEVGCILFTRVFCKIKQYTPRIFVKYSSLFGPNVIPRYEDRPLHEGIKAQITSAGGVIVNSEFHSDFLFAVHSPGKEMFECSEQANKDVTYYSYGNMHEFISYINFYRDSLKKPCAVADVCYSNGADNEFMDHLSITDTLSKICSYCGWNTSQNTDGLSLSHAIICSYYNMFSNNPEKYIKSNEYLVRHLIEGWLFEANVLIDLAKDKEDLSFIDPYEVGIQEAFVVELITDRLEKVISAKLKGEFIDKKIKLRNVSLPWGRIFDIDFDVNLI